MCYRIIMLRLIYMIPAPSSVHVLINQTACGSCELGKHLFYKMPHTHLGAACLPGFEVYVSPGSPRRPRNSSLGPSCHKPGAQLGAVLAGGKLFLRDQKHISNSIEIQPSVGGVFLDQ